MIRAHYEHDLADLQRRLLSLAEAVERAITGAIWALTHRDTSAARRVLRDDRAIDRMRYDVEEYALLLIARQQPMAGDLRIVSALMSLASEIERIGDYAKGIAEIVLRSVSLPPLPPPSLLSTMADAAREMLRDAIGAVATRDPGAAERLEKADDRVDALYQQAQQELLVIMRERPEVTEAATYLLWAAHNLERIADRTVNIAERAASIASRTAVSLES